MKRLVAFLLAASFALAGFAQSLGFPGPGTPVASAAVCAATGGTVTSDGDHDIHSFTTSGTFTVTDAGCGNVWYLVAAGGGGGGTTGGGNAGGGGAGGLKTNAAYDYAVTASGYTVTIGAGGAENASGSNSVFNDVTATGGGKGGTYDAQACATGGSGGAGGQTSGAGCASVGGGQGNQGGNAGSHSGGSGGGAGAAAANTGDWGNPAAIAGAGLSSSISGAATYYAARGNGSTHTAHGGDRPAAASGIGGLGSGKVSGVYTVGTVGTANTGSGGGGGTAGYSSQAGGSGIVIVRFKARFIDVEQAANEDRFFDEYAAVNDDRYHLRAGRVW